MNVKKLEDVCDFISGLWTGKKPPYINVGVIRNTNFHKNGSLDFSDIAQLDVEVKQFSTRQLKFGDIVLEKSGGGPKQPVGRVCVFDKEDGLYSLSNFTSAIRIKNPKELDYRYLHYYLKHLYVAGETEKIQTHSTGIRNLQLGLYKEFLVPLPPLATQQLIVTKLDSIFAEIDIATAVAVINSKNAEALFQSYLTEIFERGGEGWNTTVLDKVCKVDRGSSPRPIKEYFTENDDGVNWIKIGDTEEGGKYIFSTNQKITKVGAEKSRYVEVGDFILTNSMSYGRPYIMRINGYIHDGWFVLRLNKDIDSEYFYYLLTSPYVQKQFQSLAAGAVVKNISGDLVKKTVLPIPSLSEQKKLAEIFSEKQTVLKRLSEVYSEKLNELSMLKKSILTKAFAGELVKE